MQTSEPCDASRKLLERKAQIILKWEQALEEDIPNCKKYSRQILRDSMPDFLDILAETLSGRIGVGQLAAVSKIHAQERAGLTDFTIGQVLWEYHHLRNAIVTLLPVATEELNLIHDYIDRALAEAAEEFSSQEQELRQRFVLALSHDLRTPLSSTNMAAGLLTQNLEKSQFETLRSTIVRNVSRAGRMIEDLLDASRIQAGHSLKIKPSLTRLDHVANDVIEDLKLIYGDRFILDAAQTEGYFDARSLRRVLENLVSNAVKYGRPKTPIKIRVGEERENIFLSVYNEGETIPKLDQTEIFDQFRRGKLYENNSKGWGIGLTIVRGVVRAHGGRVEVDSPFENGTQFKILLPKRPNETN